MNQQQMIKQMIDFYQASFNNAFNANTVLQDQFERMAYNVLDQAVWFPAEGRQAVDQWVKSYKTGRDNFKKFMDDGYKDVSQSLAG